jgi:hypothetical protein
MQGTSGNWWNALPNERVSIWLNLCQFTQREFHSRNYSKALLGRAGAATPFLFPLLLSLNLLPLKWWPKPQNTVELFFVSFWQISRKCAVHWLIHVVANQYLYVRSNVLGYILPLPPSRCTSTPDCATASTLEIYLKIHIPDYWLFVIKEIIVYHVNYY